MPANPQGRGVVRTGNEQKTSVLVTTRICFWMGERITYFPQLLSFGIWLLFSPLSRLCHKFEHYSCYSVSERPPYPYWWCWLFVWLCNNGRRACRNFRLSFNFSCQWWCKGDVSDKKSRPLSISLNPKNLFNWPTGPIFPPHFRRVQIFMHRPFIIKSACTLATKLMWARNIPQGHWRLYPVGTFVKHDASPVPYSHSMTPLTLQPCENKRFFHGSRYINFMSHLHEDDTRCSQDVIPSRRTYSRGRQGVWTGAKF